MLLKATEGDTDLLKVWVFERSGLKVQPLPIFACCSLKTRAYFSLMADLTDDTVERGGAFFFRTGVLCRCFANSAFKGLLSLRAF